MNDTRLLVLGALMAGPMHGHEIRRQAQLDRAELWTDVRPGSLYGQLHRLAAEAVIEAVRVQWASTLGRPAVVTRAVERLTGHPGRGYAQRVSDHATDFRQTRTRGS